MSTIVSRGTVSISRVDASGERLIAFRGEHDLATLPLLELETLGVWQKCVPAVIDFSEAEFIDSGVIRWLVQAVRQLDVSGAPKLRIVEGGPDSAAARALVVFGLRDQLDCYPTLEAARAARDAEAGRISAVPTGSARTSVHVDPAPMPSQPDPGATAGALFDQLATRAWALALWIVKDEHVAGEVLIRALGQRSHARLEAAGDAETLWSVRRHAIALARFRPQVMPGRRHHDGSPPRSRAEAHAIRVRDAITALPAPQRVTLELALFARLTPGEIASLTATPRSEVLTLLGTAMRALKPLGHAGRAVPVIDTARLRLVRQRFAAGVSPNPPAGDLRVAASQARRACDLEGR